MAIQFNENNTGVVYTAATAIDAFRLGLMVNPTTGANVSRTLSDQRTDVQNVFGFTTTAEQDASILLVSVARAVPVGSAVITDRTIIIDGPAARLSALSQGAHVSFYNCRIIIRQWDNASATLTPPIGTFSSAGTGGAGVGGRETPTNFANPTTGRSINCYGCTIHIAEETARHNNVFGNFGDFIGSDVTFGGPTTRPGGMAINFTYQTGGRFINSAHVCNPTFTQLQSLQGYSFSDIFEGARLYSCGMTSGNASTATSAGSGPRLLTEAQFTYDDQTNYFLIQADNRSGWNQAANSFLQLGFRTPPSNSSRGGAVGNNDFGNNNTDYLGIVNGAGSVYNFAGYLPTYNDLATGNPIEGVRVRVATSALKGTANTGSTTGNWHNQITADNTEKTLGTNFYANQYLTDNTGQLVTDRYTLNGWTTSPAGAYDPFRFDTRTGPATSQLASLDLDTIVLDAPEHCAPVLLQHLKGTSGGTGNANAGFTRHQARYQARSYTHSVSEDFTESSTTLPDGSARDTSADYTIDRTIRNDLTRTGIENTNEATALTEFDTTGFKRPQEVYEVITAFWANYATDVEPTVSGSTVTWNGDISLTDSAGGVVFTDGGTAVSIPRISRLNSSPNFDTISGINVTVDTDVVGVNLTATGVLTLANSISISDSVLTAGSGFSNFPTTLDGSITFNGSFRYTSGVNTLTVTDSSNLGGLTLIVNAGATVNIRGAVASDFLAITGSGTVNFIVDYTITNTRTDGLLTVFRTNGGSVAVDSGVTTTISNILANEIVDVVYTETNRTDFLQRIPGSAAPTTTTIAVMNAPNEAPNATITAGIFVPQVPTGGVMNINVTESITDGGEVNYALQNQVKGTLNYNSVVQQAQVADIIVSDGATSGAAANSDHIRFISSIPANVAFIRDTSDNADSQSLAGPKTTLNIQGGGTVEVGVTINAPAGFDPAITGGQIASAVTAINNNTDAELVQVTTDVRQMRDNDLLGLAPQDPRA